MMRWKRKAMYGVKAVTFLSYAISTIAQVLIYVTTYLAITKYLRNPIKSLKYEKE
jgi:hypothetical protein